MYVHTSLDFVIKTHLWTQLHKRLDRIFDQGCTLDRFYLTMGQEISNFLV
jgi:hypothetical protein